MLILLFAFHVGVFAQKGKKYEQIKAEKIAYITTELNLTPEEAKVFWPVHDKYSEKRMELRSEERKLKKELQKAVEGHSGNPADIFDEILKNEEKKSALMREYRNEFLKVLPEEKVYLFFLAEEKFKRYLLKKIKEGAKK